MINISKKQQKKLIIDNPIIHNQIGKIHRRIYSKQATILLNLRY